MVRELLFVLFVVAGSAIASYQVASVLTDSLVLKAVSGMLGVGVGFGFVHLLAWLMRRQDAKRFGGDEEGDI